MSLSFDYRPGGNVKFGRKSRDNDKGLVVKTVYSISDVDRIVHDASQREGKPFRLTEGQRKTLKGSTA
jgi:hypothetical protein